MARLNKNNFARRVRHALIDHELSVTELASRVGHPRETVSRAISGTKFPLVRAKIADALSIALN